MWPFLAPAKHIRDDVIMCTDNPPTMAMATRVGIAYLNQPSAAVEKSCNIKIVKYYSKILFSK